MKIISAMLLGALVSSISFYAGYAGHANMKGSITCNHDHVAVSNVTFNGIVQDNLDDVGNALVAALCQPRDKYY